MATRLPSSTTFIQILFQRYIYVVKTLKQSSQTLTYTSNMSFSSERFSNRFDTVVNEFRRWNLVAQQMWIPYSIIYYVSPTREDLISSPLFRYSTACWIEIYRQVDWRDISALFEVESDNLDDLIDAVSARLERYRGRGPCSYTFIRRK